MKMNIKLKLRIETPYGEATKIKVNSEGEVVFVTQVKGEEKDSWGVRKYVDEEFSLGSCRICVEEENLGE
jgi:hypothetical protein